MKFSPTLLVALFGLTLQYTEAREMRTLTNADGKKIEAELISMKDGKVRIMANRRVFEVRLIHAKAPLTKAWRKRSSIAAA